jgi:hypothetical protein
MLARLYVHRHSSDAIHSYRGSFRAKMASSMLNSGVPVRHFGTVARRTLTYMIDFGLSATLTALQAGLYRTLDRPGPRPLPGHRYAVAAADALRGPDG